MSKFGDVSTKLLCQNTSDHSPIVLKLVYGLSRYGPFLFRFQNIWISNANFLIVVESSWMEPTLSSGGFLVLADKLKRLKHKLQDWNKIFGRLDGVISELEERIEILKGVLQSNLSVEVENDCLVTKTELEIWIKREDT